MKEAGSIISRDGSALTVSMPREDSTGTYVRKGDLLATVTTRYEVLTLMGRFIQYYRENAP